MMTRDRLETSRSMHLTERSRVRQALFLLRHPFHASGHPAAPDSKLHSEIASRFASISRPFELDPDAFARFKSECGYAESYVDYMGPELLDEKLLEHFVSVQLLRPRAAQVWIDVGSASSPFADYIAGSHSCEVYRLDRSYSPGVRGGEIGADASAIPLASATVDRLTLHCAIDHFEGFTDTLFVREAARVLRPGGLLCVLPVYFASRPANVCDPRYFSPRVRFDPGARVLRAPRYNNRFGRYYSPRTFERRILEAAAPLEPTLYSIECKAERPPNTYLRYALVLRKPGGGRQAT